MAASNHHKARAPLLRLSAITKRFGTLLANDAIDLDVAAGEIVALLGENGAGKTTLMSILFGHYVADTGEVQVANAGGHLAPLQPGAPEAALAAGIGMVHQHFALALNLTGLENIILGTTRLWAATIPRATARHTLDALIAEVGLAVDLDVPVHALSVGERQRIEILKALYRDARLLVLDEPTAVLTPQEAGGLFTAVRRLAARGLGVIFITHKLAEVHALADRVVVLRAGRKVADLPAAGADRATLARHMLGRAIESPRKPATALGAPVLQLISASAGSGRDRLIAADLDVRAGEIVGIAGVSGNGQRGLAGLVAGTEPLREGQMLLLGQPATGGPRARIAAGVGRLTEDRLRDGVVADLTVAENLVLERTRTPAVQRYGGLRHAAIRDEAESAITAFDVRGPGVDAPIRLLSGGNIQKVLLARALHGEPRLILANQPTRGLDIGASADVNRRLLEAAAGGAGVLLISEELDELLTLADRIAVLHAGHLTPAAPAGDLDIATIGQAMAGHPTGALASPSEPVRAAS